MKQPPRSVLLVLALTLPLLLSQCSRSQKSHKVRHLNPSEFATFSGLHSSWKDRRSIRSEPPDLPEDRLETLANLLLLNREYESSLLNYLQILKDHPERHDLRYKVGIIFILNGQLDAAQQVLAEVLVHRPEMLEAHEAMGLVHFLKKQYPQAIVEFQEVLAREPRRGKTHHILGITYLAAGETRRAILELESAARSDPKNVATLTALGQAYNSLQDYPKAIAWLKKGLALDPNNRRVNYFLGESMAALKCYPEAMKAFCKAGDEAMAYNNIGVHYFMEGRYEDAAKCFQRALELKPTFYQEAKLNLQRTLKQLQQNY